MTTNTYDETPETICAWADATFGPCDPTRAAERAAEEMKEFSAVGDMYGTVQADDSIRVCARQDLTDEQRVKLLAEAADVVICLYRFASTIGADLYAEIDRKMRINRGRTWHRLGDGTGQHVKPDTSVTYHSAPDLLPDATAAGLEVALSGDETSLRITAPQPGRVADVMSRLRELAAEHGTMIPLEGEFRGRQKGDIVSLSDILNELTGDDVAEARRIAGQGTPTGPGRGQVEQSTGTGSGGHAKRSTPIPPTTPTTRPRTKDGT